MRDSCGQFYVLQWVVFAAGEHRHSSPVLVRIKTRIHNWQVMLCVVTQTYAVLILQEGYSTRTCCPPSTEPLGSVLWKRTCCDHQTTNTPVKNLQTDVSFKVIVTCCPPATVCCSVQLSGWCSKHLMLHTFIARHFIKFPQNSMH